MRIFLNLTKSGIVWFVLLSAFIGFAMAISMGREWDSSLMGVLLVSLYLVSSGSFTLNQAQEWKVDALMNRTKNRPIPSGIILPWQGFFVGCLMVLLGLLLLMLIQPFAAFLSLLTVIMYNGLYTLYWKKHWSFGAVPGAIPGAMPVLIGFSAAGGSVLSAEALYLFMLMFLWQMPHFWCLAIRFKDDYSRAGIPVLPVHLGVNRTLYHIGLYVFAYVGLALAAPWFFKTHVAYILLVVPIAIKLLFAFFQYFSSQGERSWLPFFLWTNISMLAFLAAPVIDRWLFLWMLSY
ncbi:MAG: protoheme IX farnesyltransferase [Bdellovibrionales bacterium]|nr:protoheme IX farnesyltransferase [Bdellovibrionales bacterium]